MKYIVTGGAGFIGHNVVRQLEAQGHECFVVDNINDYGFIPKDELKYLSRERKRRIRASVHHIDIRNYRQLETFFMSFGGGISAVIHLAGCPRQKIVNNDPLLSIETMGTGLVKLLELTKIHHIPKFVYVSSSAVYGTFDGNISEDHYCQPIGQYGILKLMGEHLVRDYSRCGFFDHVILRPSAVYGELSVENSLVYKFILAAMQEQPIRIRNGNLGITYVEDIALGITSATLSKIAANNTYNLANSSDSCLLNAANSVVSIVGRGSVDLQDMSAKINVLNTDAARRNFGYKPTVDLETGITRCYNWIKNSTYWKNKI